MKKSRRGCWAEKELYEIIMRRHNLRLFRIGREYVEDGTAEISKPFITGYSHLSRRAGRRVTRHDVL